MPSTVPTWVQDAVFYQIFPDRFARSWASSRAMPFKDWDAPPTATGYHGGDLRGITAHLGYLTTLGFNALYLNPIFSSPSNHRYHTHDYWQVDPILGGNAGLRELLDASHDRGVRVILDGVFNHASRSFLPFADLLELGTDSAYRDWFTVHGFPLDAFGPRAPNYEAWAGVAALPKFNTAHPPVRDFIRRVAVHWLEFGCDGWRLDVPFEIDDDGFWREFRRVVKDVNPEAYIVGELWGNATRWLQGDQFDGATNYPFTRLAIGYCAAATLDEPLIEAAGNLSDLRPLDGIAVAAGLEELFERHPLAHTLCQLNPLGSHDTPRVASLCRDLSAVRLAVTMQMTVPGAPCVYYGDEVGMFGGNDPDNRRTMRWSEAIPGSDPFASLTLSELHRQLIALRHRHIALRRGDFRLVYASQSAIAFERRHGDETITVVLNTSASVAEVTLPSGDYRLLWGSVATTVNADHVIRIDGRQALVLRQGIDQFTLGQGHGD